MEKIKTLEFKDDALHLIDQRKLPATWEIFICRTHDDVHFAIKEMVVRGAPAIGAAAAYGAVLAAIEFLTEKEGFYSAMKKALAFLATARPTAVNLMWALKKMEYLSEVHKGLSAQEIYIKMKEAADKIFQDDLRANKEMGKYGSEIVAQEAVILTHCNTGALATTGFGTALGVIRAAFYEGKNIFVYADETRPRLQGARLTAWELAREGIPAKLIVDAAAATLIRDGKIDLILVGADRIAANGDTANKIGTFMLSVLAKEYRVPFYVVAPTSTIDFDLATGQKIVIEERQAEEITHLGEIRLAPPGIEVYNPAFDVTPQENITGIITEKGIIRPPYSENISSLRRNCLPAI